MYTAPPIEPGIPDANSKPEKPFFLIEMPIWITHVRLRLLFHFLQFGVYPVYQIFLKQALGSLHLKLGGLNLYQLLLWEDFVLCQSKGL